MEKVGGPPDREPLDDLIDEVVSRREPGVPLWVTITEVYYEALDNLDDRFLDALEYTGYLAVSDGGAPLEMSVPEALEQISHGRDYDSAQLSTETEAKLGIIGFITLAGERLMQSESEN